MHTITIKRESDDRNVEASVEAWLTGVLSVLTPAQKTSVLDRVQKIDREGIRSGTVSPSSFTSRLVAQGQKP